MVRISVSSSSGDSLHEFHTNILQDGEALGYQFEPRRDSNNGSGESADIEGQMKRTGRKVVRYWLIGGM